MTARSVEGWFSPNPNIQQRQVFTLQDTGDAETTTTAGVGAVPTASGAAGVTVSEYGQGTIHKTTFTLDAVALTMTDATTAGSHGAIQLYDFPQGNLLYLGGTTNLTLSSNAAGLTATAAVVGSVGTATVGVDNATLTGTEADLIPSTSCTLSSSAGTMKGKSATATVAAFDGTATAKDAFLNFAVPDAGSTDGQNDVMTVSGTVTLVWLNLGDY